MTLLLLLPNIHVFLFSELQRFFFIKENKDLYKYIYMYKDIRLCQVRNVWEVFYILCFLYDRNHVIEDVFKIIKCQDFVNCLSNLISNCIRKIVLNEKKRNKRTVKRYSLSNSLLWGYYILSLRYFSTVFDVQVFYSFLFMYIQLDETIYANLPAN